MFGLFHAEDGANFLGVDVVSSFIAGCCGLDEGGFNSTPEVAGGVGAFFLFFKYSSDWCRFSASFFIFFDKYSTTKSSQCNFRAMEIGICPLASFASNALG